MFPKLLIIAMSLPKPPLSCIENDKNIPERFFFKKTKPTR
jgi:hypothetical protein